MAKKQDKEPDRKPNGDGPHNGDGKPHAVEASPLTTGGAVTQAQLNVIGQYVRDISFESPNAPQTLQGPGENRSSRSLST
ncbi:MAG: protein-export chaperone SecB [Methyloceanibacter sp.]|uniref:protein-export chaperone SecB n=1 Tax=Methyloceanibacter sp. TaxID=1965321 RepID=UPI003D9B87C8